MDSEKKGSDQNRGGSSSQVEGEKWGTHVMGAPAAPSAHPLNQEAAKWARADYEPQVKQPEQSPYVQHTPVQHHGSPIEAARVKFNKWSKKAETTAANIWQNLKTGPSVSEVAWGKLSLTAKAISEGGFEAMYKQTFPTDPSEKLKKTFACYLSTTTGPVAGTLYLSNVNVAFCSDRPLAFTAPSGQQSWSYYKVLIPLAKIKAVDSVTMKEKEKYVQIVTVDGHEFWFMGFVNHEKAFKHLFDSVSTVAAMSHQPPPSGPQNNPPPSSGPQNNLYPTVDA
ncbi:hypothetical protein AMTRI_Chr06g192510 [Amborella trichopoda]|uniref:GRAM domain-containing protein n=1 Tax=Amborella trichopoda TaxID=13333 RepID=W1P8I2_AMBTC|nr:GEM-like protein 5 [Amborella trichopoda]ERN06167.1 hypothetical protein AMTR_s00016p00120390 [Amborella trichopoda]|eukprot:XP_006844492.1 GEM-like protein 5 [Amborella trichopoda]